MATFIGMILGYFFAIVIGHIAIQIYVDSLWKSIGWEPGVESDRQGYFLPRLIGIIERTLYVVSLQMGFPEFIAVWLALKVAGQWHRWAEKGKIGNKEVEGRVFYNIFLIGSGLSIAYAIGGAEIIEFYTASQWVYIGLLSLTIVIGTVILNYLTKYWIKKTNLKK